MRWLTLGCPIMWCLFTGSAASQQMPGAIGQKQT